MEYLLWLSFFFLSFFLSFHVLSFIWRHFLRKPTNWSRYSNQWAIVIGCSEGLGEAFAVGLAKRGMNVVLIARTASKLLRVADRIQSETKQKTKILVVDVTEKGWIDSLAKEIENLDICLLINNAGGTICNFRRLLDYTPEEIEKHHQFNTGYVIQSIRLVLPILLSKRCGGILNMGSLVVLGASHLIPYSSEKAKLNSLTESLALEYADNGVTIQCATHGRISTPSYQAKVNRVKSWDTPTPEQVAECTLNMFGTGAPNFVPYWSHDLLSTAIQYIGTILRLAIIRRVYEKMYKNQNKK